jgi:hypothetical protein
MTNILRDQMVRRAVQKAQNGKFDINIRNVAMFLPGPTANDAKLREQEDFALDADDLRPWLPVPGPEPGSLAERLKDVEIEYVEPNPSERPAVRYAALEAKAIELEQERADLRVTFDVAIRDELNARHELDSVARAFMNGFAAPMTPDQLLKQHAASEAETRAKIARGELPGRRAQPVGPSVLDRFMAAQRGGNPGFAGRAYARGASPVSKRLMPFARTPQAAGQPGGPPLPKLPSDR